MLNFLKIFIVIILINFSCSTQKNLLKRNIETIGSKQSIEDSILQKLQSENDLVIAYAIENFAWVRSINYRIITKNNNQWKGFIYHKNLMPNNAGSPTSFTTININKPGCDSLFNYITENKVWNIKGDSEDGFALIKASSAISTTLHLHVYGLSQNLHLSTLLIMHLSFLKTVARVIRSAVYFFP